MMKLRVGKKLVLGFSVVLLIMACISAVSLNRLFFIDKRLEMVTDVWMPGEKSINQLNYLTEHIVTLTYQHVIEPNPGVKQTLNVEINTYYQKINNEINAYNKTIFTEDNRKNFDEFTDKWKKFILHNLQTLELSEKNDPKAYASLQQGKQLYAVIQVNVDNMIEINHHGSVQAKEEAKKASDSSVIINIILLIIGLAAGLSIAYMLSVLIAKPLKKVTDNVIEVANGNLKVNPIHVKNRDEVGDLAQAANTMLSNLRMTIGSIVDSTQQVAALSEELSASAEQAASATNQITGAIQEVAEGADQQMNSAQETARAMEEMAIGIQRVAESTASITELSNQADTDAEQGNTETQQMYVQMNSIHESVDQTSSMIKLLGQRSQEIGNIVGLIQGIATQTNLLALNAGIEAARAGEHGKGFAVVAQEVRKLAEQTAESAQNISRLIEEIQTETHRTVAAIDVVSDQVDGGRQVVQEASTTFERIVSGVRKMNEQLQEVSAISEQMSASTQEVAATIDSSAKISEDSAKHSHSVASSSEEQLATMEEITATANHLSKLADGLDELTRKFRL